jgi:hypothetical protein
MKGDRRDLKGAHKISTLESLESKLAKGAQRVAISAFFETHKAVDGLGT